MFNDQYGLTQAVLEGRKTQTRRIVKTRKGSHIPEGFCVPAYEVGEEVAVAQSYGTMANEGGDILANMLQDETTFKPEYCGAGWKNKMFVKAEYMPHRVKITNVRVEHLQDISDEDCLKEGIYESLEAPYNTKKYGCFNSNINVCSPREAFAILIDKVSGKGTWKSNPWVFVYDFELIK